MATENRIGTRIKRARERKRMSQEELAAAVDASRSAVNAWENDRAYPRNRIGALEDVLGISLDGGQPGPEYDDPDLQRVWELSDGLPEDARREIVRVAGKMRTAQRGGTARPA